MTLTVGGFCGVLGAFPVIAAAAGHRQALLDWGGRCRVRRATRSAAEAAARSRRVGAASPRAVASAACSRRIPARRAASRAMASASAEGAVSSGHAAAFLSGIPTGRPWRAAYYVAPARAADRDLAVVAADGAMDQVGVERGPEQRGHGLV